jgi:hypothetical protein
MTRAAAPSLMELALAAVTVPSLLNAGLRVGILAASALAGCSSAATVSLPLRVVTVTGVSSRSKAPEAPAAFARSSEATA